MAETAQVPAKAEEVQEEKKEAPAEGAENPVPEGEITDAAPGTAPKKKKLKLILLITIPTLLLLGGGAAAYFLLFAKKHPTTEEAAQAGEAPPAEGTDPAQTAEETVKDEKPEQTFFHELPEMMVNLNSENNKVSYLKFQASLELDDQKSVDKLNKLMPRILDTIQVYVRELTVNDLKSSLGIEKLRQELLKRIVLIAKDVKIYDILFPTMLTQ